MRESSTLLTILHNDNGSYIDKSFLAFDFNRDDFDLELKDTDELLIGYHKPIDRFFIELTTQNTISGNLSLSYWNGSSWVNASNYFDDTRALTRSGFNSHDKPSDSQESEINSITKHWLKITPNVTLDPILVRGINIVFSDDNDLIQYSPSILAFLRSGKDSFINFHVASRNEIVQKIRNKGNVKSVGTRSVKLNAFDLLDVEELNLSSTYLTLSKIYADISDDTDDKWELESRRYYNKFVKAFNLAKLSIDLDDDGLKSSDEESKQTKSIRVSR